MHAAGLANLNNFVSILLCRSLNPGAIMLTHQLVHIRHCTAYLVRKIPLAVQCCDLVLFKKNYIDTHPFKHNCHWSTQGELISMLYWNTERFVRCGKIAWIWVSCKLKNSLNRC